MQPIDMTLQLSETMQSLELGIDNDSYSLTAGEQINVVKTSDYNDLLNLPQINSITLKGNKSALELGLGAVYYDTTANWDAQPHIIAERGAIYIYSDHETIVDSVGNIKNVPGVRIGDGTSFLIDLPFVSEHLAAVLLGHITNTEIHVTQAEKEFWNNKVSAYLTGDDMENLVFSKINFTTEGDIYNG
jgi:hypothetical protein